MTPKPPFQAQSRPDAPLNAWMHELQGKFVGIPECYEFLEEAREKVDEKFPNAILLMQDVTLLNSTGIGLIAALLTTVRNRGGRLVLVGLSDLTKRQLQVTHLLEFITIIDGLEQVGEAMG